MGLILQKVKLNNWKKQKTLLAIAAFAIAGSVLIIITRAATPSASLEPELGTHTTNISVVSDGLASGGSAVQFSSAAPIPPNSQGTWTSPEGVKFEVFSAGPWNNCADQSNAQG